MKTLVPYLTFAGNCEEAINFYKEAFGGEIVEIHRFDSMQGEEIPDAYKQKIMHVHFASEGVVFMASDSMPDSPPKAGDNFTLMIAFDNETEQTKIFEALSQGGTVTMPLQDTFWQARFGSITDKFGVNWSLNCDKK